MKSILLSAASHILLGVARNDLGFFRIILCKSEIESQDALTPCSSAATSRLRVFESLIVVFPLPQTYKSDALCHSCAMFLIINA